MRPVLEVLADGKERKSGEVSTMVGDRLNLSEEDRALRLKTGQTILLNRVAWAILYLVKAGAVERPRYAHVRILERGRKLLSSPEPVRTKSLDKFVEFTAWRSSEAGPTSADAVAQTLATSSSSPQEDIERGIASLEKVLQEDLLKHLLEADPAFFEQVVVDILEAMGYAGTRGSAQTLGRTGDGGVDGVVHQDALQLDSVFVQAKRYTGSVGAPEVNNFIGALDRKRAVKGVLMTTGTFSRQAVEAARESSRKVVLVDGTKLAELMVRHGVGVSTTATYKVQRVDTDYFEPDQ
ncbi:MAG: restriction endonuclease [Candidatus Thermoplasmatota archaeon]